MVVLTKQNEIDAYAAFVKAQPRGSYLAAILAGSESYVEQQIRNDFACPLAGELRELQAAAAQAADELKAARAKVAAAENEYRALARKIDNAKAGLNEIITTARKVLAAA